MLDHSTNGPRGDSVAGTISDALPVPVTLPASSRSPSVARRLLRDALGTLLPEPIMSDVELLTTELVTNAALAAGTPCVISVSVPEPDVVRVSVADFDTSTPAIYAEAGDEDVHGRGLRIVNAIALRWGIEHLPPLGKTVWFEVRAT